MIRVIVTGRNTRPFIERHAKGLLEQRGVDFRATWIDDASEDGSADLAEELFRGDPRVTIVRRERRRGPLANVIQAVGATPPEDVVVLWDGDDFFAHERVIERIAQEFAKPNVWMTYGSFETVDGRTMYRGEYPCEVVDDGTYRSAAWLCGPPRAFRAWLFQALPVGCLLDDDGEPWRTATDQATCLALLELAREHARYIDDVLYIYNDHNPQSDHHVRLREQSEACWRVRRRPRLQALESAPWFGR